ncbi:hypothetical protein [Polyangium jinanense]|uniref:hypothetical protein n=1 Tax=Polyangium jinanense TaxID=2829994 RepID=UPI002341EE4B|nr:hypothetical protein [Polyangium jinanense]
MTGSARGERPGVASSTLRPSSRPWGDVAELRRSASARGDLGELAGALEVRLVLAFGLGLGAPVRSARGGA